MTRNCTQNDLVRFLYREMSAQEHLDLLEELQSDFEMREDFNVLSNAKSNLTKVAFAPSKEAVEGILRYSRERAAVLQEN